MEVRPLVEEFLERYAAAWNAGDVDGVVACWDVPALAVADDGVDALAGSEEIRAHVAAALEGSRDRGVDRRSLSSIHVAALSSRILRVDVVWSVQNTSGQGEAREYDSYLLRIDDDDRPRMRVAVNLPAAPT
jgi:hypothetical protein